MFGLANLLQRHAALADRGRDGFFDLPHGYRSPGCWTAYTARARKRDLRLADLEIPEGELLDYALAINIQRALSEQDTYRYDRHRAGLNYSPLVLLDSPEETEHATGEINSCIRRLFGSDYANFTSKMCELVGDLLDNVWSHGKSTGISMAQKWRNPPDDGFCFEFAVADCGYGFLRELRRAGIQGIETDQAAIAWCIEKGNSTKKRSVDEWVQRLPPDAMGNPMPGIAQVVESENHHLGLGLAKLVEDLERFDGWLWLASGSSMLVISPGQKRVFKEVSVPWEGVAIACRFDSNRVASREAPEPPDEFADILGTLLRR